MAGPFTRAHLDGEAVAVLGVRALADPAPGVPPGTVITRKGDTAVIRAADGVVEVTVGDGVTGDRVLSCVRTFGAWPVVSPITLSPHHPITLVKEAP